MRHVLISGGDSVTSVLFISAGVAVGSNRSATSSSCTVNFFADVWMLLLIPIADISFFEESAADITPEMKNHMKWKQTTDKQVAVALYRI